MILGIRRVELTDNHAGGWIDLVKVPCLILSAEELSALGKGQVALRISGTERLRILRTAGAKGIEALIGSVRDKQME